jgi:hypothetical protein
MALFTLALTALQAHASEVSATHVVQIKLEEVTVGKVPNP